MTRPAWISRAALIGLASGIGASGCVDAAGLAAAPAVLGASASLSTPNAGQVRYEMALKGCPLTFQSVPGGFVALHSTDPNGGYFHRDGFAPFFDLSVTLRCVDRPPSEVCPGVAMTQGDLDVQTWRLMRVTHYATISSVYRGAADASTLTAVRPPRPRTLDFCLGDGSRTLVGKAGVGNERREYTQQVLGIIGSIRFTE